MFMRRLPLEIGCREDLQGGTPYQESPSWKLESNALPSWPANVRFPTENGYIRSSSRGAAQADELPSFAQQHPPSHPLNPVSHPNNPSLPSLVEPGDQGRGFAFGQPENAVHLRAVLDAGQACSDRLDLPP